MSIITRIKNKFFPVQEPVRPIVENVDISKHYIKKFLPRKPFVIDCGAHIGLDTMHMAKLYKGTIYAFEPVPSIYEKLVQNIKGIPGIITYKTALADFNGTSKMYVSQGASDASSSLLKPKEHLADHPDVSFSEEITVQCIELDTWAQQNNVQKIDMLWLDMQGYELPVLKKSKVIFPTVKVIHTEVSMRETYEGVSMYGELKAFLLQSGFVVDQEAIPEGYDMGNVLFVRK